MRGLDHRAQHRGRRHRPARRPAALDRDLDQVDAVAGQPADGQPGLRRRGEERGEPVRAPGLGRVAVGRGEDRPGHPDVRGAGRRAAVPGAAAQRVPARRAEVADADHAAAQGLLGRAEREVHVRVDDPRPDPGVPGADHPHADRDRYPARRADPVDGPVRGDQHHPVVRLDRHRPATRCRAGRPRGRDCPRPAARPAAVRAGRPRYRRPSSPAGRSHHPRPGHRHMMLRAACAGASTRPDEMISSGRAPPAGGSARGGGLVEDPQRAVELGPRQHPVDLDVAQPGAGGAAGVGRAEPDHDRVSASAELGIPTRRSSPRRSALPASTAARSSSSTGR